MSFFNSQLPFSQGKNYGYNIGGDISDVSIDPRTTNPDMAKLEAQSSHNKPIYKFPNDLGNNEFGNGHYISFQVMKAVGIKLHHSSESQNLDTQSADIAKNIREQTTEHSTGGDTLGPGYQYDDLSRGPVQDAGAYYIDRSKAVADRAGGIIKNLGGSIENYSKANVGRTTVRYPATEPQESVYLYIPGRLDTSYNTSYEGESLAGIKSIGDIWTAYQGFVHGDLSRQQAAASGELARISIMNQGLKSLDAIPNIVGINTNFESAAQAILREVPNPHMEMLFKGVGFRKFSFQFMFYPRNQDEAIMAYNIIKVFKLNSMPSLSPGGRFYEYPNEFKIRVFSSEGQENRYVHQFLPCACENVQVSYGEEGAFTTFERIPQLEGNAPTKITLQLEFTELSLLDRNKIMEGGY